MPIPGPKILLLGDSGTGKTYSLRTLVDAGITPFVLFTEQSMETLGDLPEGSWHWTYAKPATQDWASLIKMNKDINRFNFEMLSKSQDSNRTQYTGMLDFLETCNNFKCQCHNETFGDVGKWGTNRALIVDGLSGFSAMALYNTVGGKPTRSPAEWGVAMDIIRSILTKLCTDTQCTFILISHLAREKDEITGGTNITLNTLGQKLAPDLPRMFSDIIQTVRVGTDFSWDTAGPNIVTKTRNIPIASKQKPSFVPLFTEWKRKGGVISSST